MPKLIQDTDTMGVTGQKNAAIMGSHLFDTNGLAHKQFTDVHLVQADAPTDTEDTILATPGLISLGEPVRDSWCVSRTARCIDDTALLWEVRYQFSSDTDNRIREAWFNDGDGYRLKRPEEMMPRTKWGVELITEPLLRDQEERDMDGVGEDPATLELKLIINSVGESLFPDTLRGITVMELEQFRIGRYAGNSRARKYTSTLNDAGQETYDYFGNQLAHEWFYGAPHACCWCSSIRTEEMGILTQYGDTAYLKETIQFKFRWWFDYDCDHNLVLPNRYKKSWILNLLNQGNKMHEQQGDSLLSPIETVASTDITRSPQRVNLDEHGFRLAPGDRPVWLQFNKYPVRKFGPFSTDSPPYDTYATEMLVDVRPPEPLIDPDPVLPDNQDFPPILATPSEGYPCDTPSP